LRICDGCVEWKWARPGPETSWPSREAWTIRLPIADGNCKFGYLDLSRSLSAEPLLFDVNYLTNVFQPALASAAQRVFDHAERSTSQQRAATAR